jgi:hypothetical protein
VTVRSREWSSTTALGGILIALGVVFLAAQVTGFELGREIGRYGWPVIIVVIGGAMFLMGLTGVDPSRGSIFPGTIVMTVGGILLYQNTFRHWESWAYVWALIPASIGLATALRGALTGHGGEARRGISMPMFFLIIFALGAFFEGVLRISGRDFGLLAQYGFPILLILVGLWLVVARTTRVSFDWG